MTQTNRRAAHGATQNGSRPRGADLRSPRLARIRRGYDGVVASYLREISLPAREAAGSGSS